MGKKLESDGANAQLQAAGRESLDDEARLGPHSIEAAVPFVRAGRLHWVIMGLEKDQLDAERRQNRKRIENWNSDADAVAWMSGGTSLA